MCLNTQMRKMLEIKFCDLGYITAVIKEMARLKRCQPPAWGNSLHIWVGMSHTACSPSALRQLPSQLSARNAAHLVFHSVAHIPYRGKNNPKMGLHLISIILANTSTSTLEMTDAVNFLYLLPLLHCKRSSRYFRSTHYSCVGHIQLLWYVFCCNKAQNN